MLEDGRQKFFSTVLNALNPDVSWKKIDTLRIDENYILWHKTKGVTHTGVEKTGDTYWSPQRRIYPLEKLKDDLIQHSFKILAFDLEKNNDGPYMVRAMCSKK